MIIKKLFTLPKLLVAILMFSVTHFVMANDYTVTGPYNKNNLSIYLIQGQDRIKSQSYLTLGEAMQEKKVKVHETSKVNQLSIENMSQSQHIYIQAGDIVKGGKQDRVFSTDMVLEPGSGKINIASFCVEQGRWNKRGKESAKEFNSSTKKLSSKELRLAARLKNNQSEVWQEVAKAQQKLSHNVGGDVKSKDSGSSLQLSLENKRLQSKTTEYKKEFLSLLSNKNNVIGYAFAINGKLNTADIYANQSLLKKLWPKIIDAMATESVAEHKKERIIKNPEPVDVEQWMKNAKQGTLSTRELKPGLMQDTVENDTEVRFDTYSGSGTKKKLYRQNYIKK